MPTELLYKGLTAPTKATPRHAVKLATEGICTAIVAVTGVTDAVEDLIVPGAFAATLKVRRPKVVDDHQWGNRAGRVLHVEEWMPGDPRLPKRTKDGKQWPAEAGALVATMQYNLNSDRGRESFEWVRFYAESNEAEFSIGYKVPDGKSRRRSDGVRVILAVDLFEFSHVLFGAAPLSMALEVKQQLNNLSGGTIARPALGKVQRRDVEADDEPPTDGSPLDPDAEWDDDEEDEEERAKAPYEAKTAAHVLLEAKAGGWDANAGNAETLRRYWTTGEGAAKIGWNTDGDHTRCVRYLSEYMSVDEAHGYCNLRSKEVTGHYSGEAESKDASHTYTGADVAATVMATFDALQAGDGDALAEASPVLFGGARGDLKRSEAKDAEAPAPTEGKGMNTMKGSYEDRIEAIQRAAGDLLSRDGDERCYVSVVATYDTEVIVMAYPKDEPCKTMLLPYSVDEDGNVALEEPQPVELSLVAEPGDGDAEPVPTEDVEDVTVVGPMLAKLEALADLARFESKAGAAVREHAATLFGLEGKSAAVVEEDEAVEDAVDEEDNSDGPIDDPAPEPSGDVITANSLPEGEWDSYRKTAPIEAMKMDGPFSVETREGVVHSDGGWLAVDSDGFPYPIADEEFEEVYEPAPDEGEVEDPDVAAEEEAARSAEEDEPTDEAEGETVTLNPDEHFDTMAELDADGEGDAGSGEGGE